MVLSTHDKAINKISIKLFKKTSFNLKQNSFKCSIKEKYLYQKNKTQSNSYFMINISIN